MNIKSSTTTVTQINNTDGIDQPKENSNGDTNDLEANIGNKEISWMQSLESESLERIKVRTFTVNGVQGNEKDIINTSPSSIQDAKPI